MGTDGVLPSRKFESGEIAQVETNFISISFSSPLLAVWLVLADGIHRLYTQYYILVLSWSFTSCATLGNSFNSSESLLTHL